MPKQNSTQAWAVIYTIVYIQELIDAMLGIWSLGDELVNAANGALSHFASPASCVPGWFPHGLHLPPDQFLLTKRLGCPSQKLYTTLDPFESIIEIRDTTLQTRSPQQSVIALTESSHKVLERIDLDTDAGVNVEGSDACCRSAMLS